MFDCLLKSGIIYKKEICGGKKEEKLKKYKTWIRRLNTTEQRKTRIYCKSRRKKCDQTKIKSV